MRHAYLKGNRVKEKLTERQRAIFEYIRERVIEAGHPPTIREIGKKFGITSTNGVRTHLKALVKKGFIRKQELISRGIELVRDVSREAARVPLVGSVPAGVPIDSVENIESEFVLDQTFLPKGNTFSLKVSGESMREACILDGDMVLVQKQETAHKGDIVVALLNGEATVKRYVPEGSRIVLQPANTEFEPIHVDKRSGDFKIVGKVVGLLRKFR